MKVTTLNPLLAPCIHADVWTGTQGLWAFEEPWTWPGCERGGGFTLHTFPQSRPHSLQTVPAPKNRPPRAAPVLIHISHAITRVSQAGEDHPR